MKKNLDCKEIIAKSVEKTINNYLKGDQRAVYCISKEYGIKSKKLQNNRGLTDDDFENGNWKKVFLRGN